MEYIKLYEYIDRFTNNSSYNLHYKMRFRCVGYKSCLSEHFSDFYFVSQSFKYGVENLKGANLYRMGVGETEISLCRPKNGDTLSALLPARSRDKACYLLANNQYE